MRNKLIYNETLGKKVLAYNEVYDTFDTAVAQQLVKDCTKESLTTMLNLGLNPLNSNFFVTNSVEKYDAFTDEDGNLQPAGIAKINTTTCILHEAIQQKNETALRKCLIYIKKKSPSLYLKSFSNYVYTEPENGMPDYYIPQTQLIAIEEIAKGYKDNSFSKNVRDVLYNILIQYYNRYKDKYDGHEYFPGNLKSEIQKIIKNKEYEEAF